MARCEDFPCCGHESGCCPDFEDGRQVNMKCVCGATVDIDSRSSLCDSCLSEMDEDDYERWEEDHYDPGDMDGDHDSAMESCGWGTDEDYGYYGDEY
jgi:hypothetical protein